MAKKRFASWSVPKSKRIDKMNLWVEFECVACRKIRIVRRHSKGDGKEHLETTTINRCRYCSCDTVQTAVRVHRSDPRIINVAAERVIVGG